MPIHFKLPFNHSIEAAEWAETVKTIEPILEGKAPVPAGATLESLREKYDLARFELLEYLSGDD